MRRRAAWAAGALFSSDRRENQSQALSDEREIDIFRARGAVPQREHKVRVMNRTQTQELKEHEEKRDIFCVISDAFRVFARRSAAMLGTAWAFAAAVLIILVWILTG